MTMSRSLWFTAILSLALPLCAQEKTPPMPNANGKATPVARPAVSDGARTALAVARDLASQVKGLEGPERATAQQQAATAYDNVAADFAGEPSVAAQAAFAAGELWRSHGSLALADKAFRLAAQQDPVRYGQRARLELAEVQRRQEQFDQALATYGELIALDASTSRAQEARIWQGRTLQKVGRLDEALRAFQSALEAAQRPRQVIEACNLLARLHVQRGEFEPAQRAIEHAEQAIARANVADPIEQERLRKALETMTARKMLQRARDKADGIARDAADVEAVRRGGMRE